MILRHDIQGFDKYVYLRHEPGAKKAVLQRDFHYIDQDGIKYTAPAGMPTDGGSIPVFFYRTISPPFASPFLPAYIIHDFYCDRARHLWEEGDIDGAKKLRKEADQLFREMLLHLGCPKWKAWVMYRGVRIGALNLKNNKRA